MDLASFVSEFGGIAYTLLAFVVALSVIVAIHEYGHYIVGRWSGIHAEVFSLGFGPVLYSRVDRRGTKWQLAGLPFGGYVKFLGDANAASVGISESEGASTRNTMAGAPLWARSATVAAGPFFNFALSALIFSGVIFWGGKPADPLTIAELPPLPSQIQQGLQAGDALITINGSDVTTNEKFAATFRSLPKEPTHNYVVERDGVQLEVLGPYPSVPIVTSLAPKSAAMSVNMKINDVIVAINNFPVFSSDQVMAAVVASEGAPLLLDVWRNGQSIQFTLVPRPRDTPLEGGTFERRWMIGISMGWFFEPKTEPVGVVEAVTDGLRLTGDVITGSLNGLKQVITGAISTCNLNGPVGIAQTSGAMASQGGQSFIWFIAFLSTAVGLLNLFPIPVLDGGHLVFHAYEAITGRQPSARTLEIFMAAGVTLLLGLMVFALGHDIFCT